MVQEFEKIGMNVMGISETKWFGLGMMWIILHSGCPVPGGDKRMKGMTG